MPGWMTSGFIGIDFFVFPTSQNIATSSPLMTVTGGVEESVVDATDIGLSAPPPFRLCLSAASFRGFTIKLFFHCGLETFCGGKMGA